MNNHDQLAKIAMRQRDILLRTCLQLVQCTAPDETETPDLGGLLTEVPTQGQPKALPAPEAPIATVAPIEKPKCKGIAPNGEACPLPATKGDFCDACARALTEQRRKATQKPRKQYKPRTYGEGRAQCRAITKKGTRCGLHALIGTSFCERHQDLPQSAGAKQAKVPMKSNNQSRANSDRPCKATANRTNKPCQYAAKKNSDYCGHHQHLDQASSP